LWRRGERAQASVGSRCGLVELKQQKMPRAVPLRIARWAGCEPLGPRPYSLYKWKVLTDPSLGPFVCHFHAVALARLALFDERFPRPDRLWLNAEARKWHTTYYTLRQQEPAKLGAPPVPFVCEDSEAIVEVAPSCADLLKIDDTPSDPLVGLVGCIECLSPTTPLITSLDIDLSVAPFCADRLETNDVHPALLTVGFLKRIMCLSSLVLVTGFMKRTMSALSVLHGCVHSCARRPSPIRPLPAPPYSSSLGRIGKPFFSHPAPPFPVVYPDLCMFVFLALPAPAPPYRVA